MNTEVDYKTCGCNDTSRLENLLKVERQVRRYIEAKENKMQENKEPDYSFSTEIQQALREGKEVWGYYTPSKTWIPLNSDEENVITLRSILYDKWSLTKPKKKVKKASTRWVNIHKHNDNVMWFTYKTEAEAKEDVIKAEFFYVVAKPITIDYEVEVEE